MSGLPEPFATPGPDSAFGELHFLIFAILASRAGASSRRWAHG